MPGKQPTKDEKQRRLAIVERTISDRGWSIQVRRALAAQFGVSSSTIDNYRRELILTMRDELSAQELEERRAEFLTRLRGHQRAALETSKLGPLAAMMTLEQRIVGLDQPPPKQDDEIAALDRPQLLQELAQDLSADELRQIAALKDGGEE